MNIEHDNDAPLPEELRRSLRALRRDSAPGRDLWPGISARIAGDGQQAGPVASPPALPAAMSPSPVHRSRRSRRLFGLATAASLAAALAIGWGLLAPSPDAPSRHTPLSGATA
ncbi:MAG: hypothetical protein L0H23_09700, partial [Luteimonas sp.]|nr:hypothetical protein [Luteimonas sp.]